MIIFKIFRLNLKLSLKVQVHACRAYGNILSLCPQLNPKTLNEANSMLRVLKEELRLGVSYKGQWNAALAITKAFNNPIIIDECQTEDLIESLRYCQNMTRNLKVSVYLKRKITMIIINKYKYIFRLK